MKMHSNLIGTMSVGIRGPIIREGDDIVKTVVDTILQTAKENPMLTIESGDKGTPFVLVKNYFKSYID